MYVLVPVSCYRVLKHVAAGSPLSARSRISRRMHRLSKQSSQQVPSAPRAPDTRRPVHPSPCAVKTFVFPFPTATPQTRTHALVRLSVGDQVTRPSRDAAGKVHVQSDIVTVQSDALHRMEQASDAQLFEHVSRVHHLTSAYRKPGSPKSAWCSRDRPPAAAARAATRFVIVRRRLLLHLRSGPHRHP